MSSIKQKQGNCIDCGVFKPLIGGRCSFHYWKERERVRAAKRKASGVDVNAYEEKRELDNWYLFQISIMPCRCENCNEPLNRWAPWGAKSYVAHIVEKRNFKSVQVHPLNRLFLCIQCHTNYDNWGKDKVMQMAVFDVAIERFKVFANKIPHSEYDFLPEYFMELVASC
jgi:hypothetical protein